MLDRDDPCAATIAPDDAPERSAGAGAAPFAWSCKRGLDIVLSLIGFAALVPVFLIVFVLVKLTSRGPVLYTQMRVGWKRRPFTIYKIRTMVPESERLSGPRWSSVDDPRVTPVGRFLRRSHIDELPQLWNVLRGDMSLVGPRPERPEFVCQLEKALPRYAERLAVRPGLTGLAQVQLPPDTDHHSVRRKLICDLDYIERFNLGLDARLLLATALFWGGVPFAWSSRSLGLRTEDVERERSAEAVEGIELVTQARPAWHD